MPAPDFVTAPVPEILPLSVVDPEATLSVAVTPVFTASAFDTLVALLLKASVASAVTVAVPVPSALLEPISSVPAETEVPPV